MKVTREKLLAIWGLVNNLLAKKTNVKFHYLMLKNRRIMEPEVESLQKSNSPPEGFADFEKKRMALCDEFSDKDEDGKAVIKPDNSFQIAVETKEDFEKGLEDLKEEFSEVVKTMDNNRKEFADLLKEEIEIELVSVPVSIIQEDLVGRDVDLLFDFIDESC